MYYLFLANGFEEIEALATLDIMRRAGMPVQTVGVLQKCVTGNHSITVAADIEENEVELGKCSGVILPGGIPGTPNLEKNETVQKALEYAQNKGLLIAAICAAPSILGHKGYLKDKNATSYPDFEAELNCKNYTGDAATIDGNIITGKGAGAAIEFALSIVSREVSKEMSDKVRASMQCPR